MEVSEPGKAAALRKASLFSSHPEEKCDSSLGSGKFYLPLFRNSLVTKSQQMTVSVFSLVQCSHPRATGSGKECFPSRKK